VLASARLTAGTTEGIVMSFRLMMLCAAVVVVGGLSALVTAGPVAGDTTVCEDGIVKARSAYPLGETIARLKHDIADKKLVFFSEIDQSKLAADAGITVRPSTLLTFGNPALGTLFLTSNPVAGLDWPVRLLVFEDEKGGVWAAYTDFGYIARRHRITKLEPITKASMVIASIVSSVERRP
jgi:uncharacterized protein (DUF302 family)